MTPRGNESARILWPAGHRKEGETEMEGGRKRLSESSVFCGRQAAGVVYARAAPIPNSGMSPCYFETRCSGSSISESSGSSESPESSESPGGFIARRPWTGGPRLVAAASRDAGSESALLCMQRKDRKSVV